MMRIKEEGYTPDKCYECTSYGDNCCPWKGQEQRTEAGPMRARYKTAEDLQKKSEQYFEMCDREGLPYTVSGLAHFCGFPDLRQYKKQERRGPDFQDVVSFERLRIEAWTEEQLFNRKTYKGAAFQLLLTTFGRRRDSENLKGSRGQHGDDENADN